MQAGKDMGCFMSLRSVTMMRQFFNIVHQANQLPLPIHLGSAAQCKTVQLLVAAYVAEYRLYRRKAARHHRTPHVGVDFDVHAVGVAFRSRPCALKEGDLARFRFVRLSQALMATFARHAVLFRPRNFMAAYPLNVQFDPLP